MPLAPLTEVSRALESMSPQAYAELHSSEDVIVVEPYEKNWDYRTTAFHSGAKYQFIPRRVGEEILVGRANEAQIHLDHPLVSRRQCLLSHTAEGWQVTGLAKQDGTWMDGREFREAVEDAWGVVDPKLQDDKYYRVEDFYGPSPLPYGDMLRLNHGVVLRILRPDSLASRLLPESPS